MAPQSRPSDGGRRRAPGQLLAEVTLVVLLLAALGLSWPSRAPAPAAPQVGELAVYKPSSATASGQDHAEEDLAPPRNLPWRVPIQANPMASPQLVVSAWPVQLLISSQNLHPRVESVGVDRSGAMSTPIDYFDVGWYKLGAVPGDPGDAVIDGHAGFPDQPLIFGKLGKLKPGDRIVVVLADGARRSFAVSSVKSWPWWAHPTGLFQSDGPARLTLITCSGTYNDKNFSYAERLVVEARYLGQG